MSSTSTQKDTNTQEANNVVNDTDDCLEDGTRKIIHVDMDAFYASVEQRDNPKLQGRPVIVGGKPDGRGVVAACSYEARQYGVHSAMPSAEAGRLCPHAEFLKPRFEAYKQASQQIHAVFKEFTSAIEPLSLDEAYLDVTDNTLFEGSAVMLAREIKSLIWERTRLVASAGVSYNKFLAKIASDHEKPDGLFCILPQDGETFVASLPIGRFHGVGKVTEARMHELGIHSGADLRSWSEQELAREFGKSSTYYYQVARGIDHRPVRSSRVRKSMGSERTFGENIQHRVQMLEILCQLADELQAMLAERKLCSSTLTIKVRFADFETLTRAHSHRQGALDAFSVRQTLPFLLDRALADRQESERVEQRVEQRVGKRSGVRLLGVSFSALSPDVGNRLQQLEMTF
ncbi:MAG: DNA polymerase IV [Granulosicoccus sp.]